MNNIKQAPTLCKAFVDEITINPPDVLITGSVSEYFMLYAKYVMGIHTITASLQAIVCSENYAPLGIPVLPDKAHYDIVFKILEDIYNGMLPFDDAMESMGRQRLDEVYPKEAFMKESRDVINGQPSERQIICQSHLFKHILAPGSNENMSYVGPCILHSKKQAQGKIFFGGEEVQKQIEAFLAKDPQNKPVYCGWGSMVCKSPAFMTELVVKALQQSGERGIVLGGFAGLSLDVLKEHNPDDHDLISYAEENILFLEKASHESFCSH